ncbi:TOMM precursor leader peptide-binding protein [Streptomyces sp. NPDC002825]|uniref:TOMM precursor leader peptide-binding protein n=1 Tax=Streptomyces sp. NPDC002825 TaxID=3154666 RepID=UPI0033338B3A
MGFKGHLRVEVVAGDAAYLFSEEGVTALRGQGIEAVAPLLDGTRDRAEIGRAVPSAVADGLDGLLGALDTAGLLARRADPPPADPAAHAETAYWEAAGLDGPAARARLGAGRVHVLAVDGLPAGPAALACREAGLDVVEDPASADLTLVLCADYLSPGLRAAADSLRAAGRPWLPVRPGGVTAWIGPVFRPGAACWHCLAHRLDAHRTSELPVRRARGLSGPVARPAVALDAARSAALRLAALEAVKWLAGHRHENQSALFTLDSLSFSGRHHPVRRRPQCPACGDPGLVAERVGRPVVPVSRLKATGSGVNDRALTSRQMIERYGSLVDPLTGVVQELRRDPRAPEPLHAFTSGRNLAVGGEATLDGLRAGLRSLSGGKGATELDARVSALCEALERYSGSLHGDEPRIRDTFRALGDSAVHPNDCQLFHPRQFRDRASWNARGSLFQQVSEEFDPDAPVDWTPVWSLTHQRHRLLPTAMLYFGRGADPVAGSRFARADSNGSAAGSSVEDAIVQGFLELVERDAVALWWYNRTRQPGVDLDAFEDSWTAGLRRVYAGLNRELWALDLTSDFGIPVFAAVSRRTDKDAEDIVFGFGAHFDPRAALRRALAEMSQHLPAVAGARPDGGGYAVRDPEPLDWWLRATTADQPYLLPAPGTAPRTPAGFAYRPRPDLLDDLRAAEALVRERGMELLVLDQTRPDIGLPVVKVIVPGLRHFWARFGPGRLYDVPVELGRLAEPTPYAGLNPVPLFV